MDEQTKTEPEANSTNSFVAPEATAPASDSPAPAPAASVSPASQPDKTSHKASALVWPLVAVVALIIGLVGGYYAGHKTSAAPKTASSTSAMVTTLKVPDGANVISQCTPGLGTQYVLPKDIPAGPIYDVYQGKVIGLEFMTLATDQKVAGTPAGISTSASDLPLFGMKYDHLQQMLMPEGHAGLPVPHMMTDVLMVPTSVTSKITCASNASSSMPGMSTPAASSSSTSSSSSSTSSSTNMNSSSQPTTSKSSTMPNM